MLNYVREGDCVYIMDFSRLARSTKDLLSIVELFNKKDVQLISLKENLDTSTPTGKLMLTVIAAIHQFERENTLERQREGIAIAKREGRFKGGQPKAYDEEKFEILYRKYMNREITKTDSNQVIKEELVVLVNEYSASASEIVAGALKDHERAQIVGTKTYGKGVIQSVFMLDDGSALKLTVEEYFTPKNNKINKLGIEPHHIVELDLENEKDTQLEKAQELLK